MLSKNVGKIDRGIRFLLGLVALAFAVYYGIGSWITLIVFILGIVLIATASISFCPIYSILKYDTIFQKEKE